MIRQYLATMTCLQTLFLIKYIQYLLSMVIIFFISFSKKRSGLPPMPVSPPPTCSMHNYVQEVGKYMTILSLGLLNGQSQAPTNQNLNFPGIRLSTYLERLDFHAASIIVQGPRLRTLSRSFMIMKDLG